MLDKIDVLTVNLLNFSPVARVLEAFSSVQLGLDQSKVLLLDGVNVGEDVPVDAGGARWSGERSMVDVSVLAVNHVQEVSNGHMVNGWPVDRSVIKLHGLKERVDDSFLSPGELGSGVLHREKDTDHSGMELVVPLSVVRGVEQLELKVLSLSINGVLGASTDVHMGTSPLSGAGSEHAVTEHGLEAKVGLLIILDLGVHLDCLSIKDPADILSIWVEADGVIILPTPLLVLVGLLESVLFGLSGDQVNWRLVGASTLVVSDVKVGPVGAIRVVVPLLGSGVSEEQ